MAAKFIPIGEWLANEAADIAYRHQGRWLLRRNV
jgi:hypothetical protein